MNNKYNILLDKINSWKLSLEAELDTEKEASSYNEIKIEIEMLEEVERIADKVLKGELS